MPGIKEIYRRFKAWQRKPREYVPIGDTQHTCANCGQEYAGAFCPRCGQKATAGRITWATVHNGMMDIFGLGGRSLPYSLWQLMWRPGYFISDYINGKWQVCFPPVKMLVIVALFVFFLGKLVSPLFWDGLLEESSPPITTTGLEYYVDSAIQWLGNHEEWAILFVFSWLIIPTWFMFRHSPRNTRHTLPQGFFIQVFMAVQFILWLFVISPGFFFGYEDSIAALVLSVLMFLVVFVDYKQLFGYSWWGTLWRILCVPFIFTCLVFLFAFIYGIVLHPSQWPKYLLVFMLTASVLGFVLSLIDVIGRRLWRERGLWRSMLWPLLFIAAVIAVSLILTWAYPGYWSRLLS